MVKILNYSLSMLTSEAYKKILTITNFLSELKQKPDFILITETKFIKKRDIIVDISITGYIFVHEETTTSAGGVAMYTKVNISYSIDSFDSKYLVPKVYG